MLTPDQIRLLVNLTAAAICVTVCWRRGRRERIPAVAAIYIAQLIHSVVMDNRQPYPYFVTAAMMDGAAAALLLQLPATKFHEDMIAFCMAAVGVNMAGAVLYYFGHPAIYYDCALWAIFGAQAIRMLWVGKNDRDTRADALTDMDGPAVMPDSQAVGPNARHS